MDNTNDVYKDIIQLDWKDFSLYPQKGQQLMIRAEGYDTVERVWKNFFFELKFDPMDFPTNEMQEKLNQHHCKWKYQWLPSK